MKYVWINRLNQQYKAGISDLRESLRISIARYDSDSRMANFRGNVLREAKARFRFSKHVVEDNGIGPAPFGLVHALQIIAAVSELHRAIPREKRGPHGHRNE